MYNKFHTFLAPALSVRIRDDVNQPILDGVPNPYWTPDVESAQADKLILQVLEVRPGEPVDVMVAGIPNYDFKWVDSSWLEAA